MRLVFIAFFAAAAATTDSVATRVIDGVGIVFVLTTFYGAWRLTGSVPPSEGLHLLPLPRRAWSSIDASSPAGATRCTAAGGRQASCRS